MINILQIKTERLREPNISWDRAEPGADLGLCDPTGQG